MSHGRLVRLRKNNGSGLLDRRGHLRRRRTLNDDRGLSFLLCKHTWAPNLHSLCLRTDLIESDSDGVGLIVTHLHHTLLVCNLGRLYGLAALRARVFLDLLITLLLDFGYEGHCRVVLFEHPVNLVRVLAVQSVLSILRVTLLRLGGGGGRRVLVALDFLSTGLLDD